MPAVPCQGCSIEDRAAQRIHPRPSLCNYWKWPPIVPHIWWHESQRLVTRCLTRCQHRISITHWRKHKIMFWVVDDPSWRSLSLGRYTYQHLQLGHQWKPLHYLESSIAVCQPYPFSTAFDRFTRGTPTKRTNARWSRLPGLGFGRGEGDRQVIPVDTEKIEDSRLK